MSSSGDSLYNSSESMVEYDEQSIKSEGDQQLTLDSMGL